MEPGSDTDVFFFPLLSFFLSFQPNLGLLISDLVWCVQCTLMRRSNPCRIEWVSEAICECSWAASPAPKHYSPFEIELVINDEWQKFPSYDFFDEKASLYD